MDLLEWLISYGMTIPVIALAQWKVQEFNSCSVHEAECLS